MVAHGGRESWVSFQDYNGDTALHDAARFGHEAIVKLLCPVTDLTLKNSEGLSCEGLAAQMGKYHFFQTHLVVDLATKGE